MDQNLIDRAEYNRRYYLANPDKYLGDNKKAYKRAWYLANKARILDARKDLRASEGYAEYQHEVWLRLKSDPERLQKRYANNVKKAREYRNAIMDRLGHKCIRCGFEDPRALQIDHIDGGGRQHRLAVGYGNRSYYKSILEDPNLTEKFQVLCANCNWIKRYEEREFQQGI